MTDDNPRHPFLPLPDVRYVWKGELIDDTVHLCMRAFREEPMRKFGPKPAGHPTLGMECPVCLRVFRVGDFTTLESIHAANLEEARKAQRGEPYQSLTWEVHWDCRTGRGE